MTPPGSSTTIALAASDDGPPPGTKTGIRLTTENADSDHATLRARGVDVDEILRWEGVPPMFTFATRTTTFWP